MPPETSPSLPPSQDNSKLWRSFIVSTTLIVLLVTLAIFLGMFINNSRLIENELRSRARSQFSAIVLTRQWNAEHAGVYVEKREGVESNPYLDNPDIETIDGKVYTKKNPALMTREISELASENSDHFFHITSLKPINPNNVPDDSEREALEAFETGLSELFWTETIGERRYYRYMAPLFVEKACLQCHAKQGYKTGDVRGGISVMFEVSEVERKLKNNGYIVFAIFFVTSVIMLGSIYFFAMRLSKQLSSALTKIREMAVTDDLTKLSNRRHFFDLLGTEFNRARRYNHNVSCVLLDLDHFKKVNDTHGHQVGDQVLRRAAEIIKTNCRNTDTPARYGGEEFIIFLPETEMRNAIQAANKIRAAIEATPIILEGGGEIRVTASLGVASATLDSASDISETALVKVADEALYRAKQNGRNRVEDGLVAQ
ncbi:MAG: diguanylate cyclase [Rhodospirillales bacterium]|nr:diguanylate cyclase [Rhodospirillales bacterium]